MSLTIEEGKYYVDRVGTRVGPARRTGPADGDNAWSLDDDEAPGGPRYYYGDGRVFEVPGDDWDLVKEAEPLAAEPMTKTKLLETALQTVADRGVPYGGVEDNFARIAVRWRTHLKNRFGLDVPIDPISVAMMMIDMKQARLEGAPRHQDSIVDIAGYAACLGELADG